MKTSQKLLLLSVLGLGALVYEKQVHAETKSELNAAAAQVSQTTKQIDSILLKKADELQKADLKDLKSVQIILENLQKELRHVIQRAPDASLYSKLLEAVEKLQPSSVYALIAPLKTILSHASDQARAQIKSKLPAHLAVWL